MDERLVVVVTFVLLLSLVLVIIPVKAQTASSIVINPDGSVTGTYSIEQVGNIYTLMGNISGNMEVERSNIIINGSGYTLDGNGNVGIDLSNGVGQNPSNPTIDNVTTENLHVTNCGSGISTDGGGNNTFYDDDFSDCGYGAAIRLMDCSYNNISYCNFDSESQISMDYSANFNVVTKCNLPSSNSILVWLSGSEAVDRNYWSDYTTKYPNATEIDHSGVGNTSYVFSTVNENGKLLDVYEDNHPLMQPVAIPLMGSNPQTKVPEFPPSQIILLLLLSVLFVAMIFRNRKQVKKLLRIAFYPNALETSLQHKTLEKVKRISDWCL
jgi:hypothetical protein